MERDAAGSAAGRALSDLGLEEYARNPADGQPVSSRLGWQNRTAPDNERSRCHEWERHGFPYRIGRTRSGELLHTRRRAIVGASLRFILYRGTLSAAGSRRSWIMEAVLAFGLGVLAGVVLVAESGLSLSRLGLGALAGLAAYADTALAVSWMGQKYVGHAPVAPAVHLLVTLFVSLAGAATVMAIAGQF